MCLLRTGKILPYLNCLHRFTMNKIQQHQVTCNVQTTHITQAMQSYTCITCLARTVGWEPNFFVAKGYQTSTNVTFKNAELCTEAFKSFLPKTRTNHEICNLRNLPEILYRIY